VETFEPKRDRLQKIRYLLTRLKTTSELPTALERLVSEGIFTRSESTAIEMQTSWLLDDPELSNLYEDGNDVQINKELLVPGGKLLHIDRVVRRKDGGSVFMSFIGGSNADDARRHLKKLINTYKRTG